MINPHPAPAVSAAPVVAPATSDAGIPQDAGVYLVLKGVVTEMEPEVVGWQTGGVMKSFATQGLTKGHTNGKIMKPKSVPPGVSSQSISSSGKIYTFGVME
jgi:hypothetical protein